MTSSVDLDSRPEFFGTSPDELTEILGGSGRARLPWRMARRGEDPFTPGTLVAGAHQRLVTGCRGTPLQTVRRRLAECGTTKLLCGLRDGAGVETVIIPSQSRTTVCVSSQVGCARGCIFCHTGAMGLVRSLSAAEMVAQVHLALAEVRHRELAPLRNVVFMGMGEPLDNLEQVTRAIALLTDPHGFGVGPSRITLSTIGTSPQAVRRTRDLPVGLAWSLHTPDPDLRERLIPNARHDLEALRGAFLEVTSYRGADLFVEITLIRGINDSPDDARSLVEFLAPMRPKVRVNLLPLNACDPELEPATEARTEEYRATLYAAGLRCIIRRPRGAEMGAACGQLGGELCEALKRTPGSPVVSEGV